MILPHDGGAAWRDAFAQLEAIMLDPNETTERRTIARRAVHSVRVTSRSSAEVLQGNRGGNDSLSAEADYEGWEPRR